MQDIDLICSHDG